MQTLLWWSAVAFVCTSSCIAQADSRSWTQLYIGGGIGADAVHANGSVAERNSYSRASGLAGGDFGATVTIGADYQFNQSFVGGVFGSYDWSAIDVSASATDGTEYAAADLLSVDSSWTIGARGGVLFTPDTLLYGLVGYTQAKLSGISVSAPGFRFNYSPPTYKALTLGAGVEHRFAPNISLRAEYRYSNFGRDTDFQRYGVRISSEKELHSGRIVAAYRFGVAKNAEVSDSDDYKTRNWTGFHVGLGIGLDGLAGDAKLNVPGLVSAKGSGIAGGNFSGTLGIGYDYQVTPKWLVGAVAYFDWSPGSGSVSGSMSGNVEGIRSVKAKADILSLKRAWMVGLRAGRAISSDSMIFGLAGYTQVEFNDPNFSVKYREKNCYYFSYYFCNTTVGNLKGRLKTPTFSGFVLGGGFEKYLSKNVSLRAEYRYTNLESKTVFRGTVDTDDVFLKVNPEIHAVRLMLNFRN